MPRPTDDERCAVCFEAMRECRAGDINLRDPGDTRTHLQFMYDRQRVKFDGSDQDFERSLVAYALNRYLAPFRDNLRKKQGERASRTYESRNLKGQKILAALCGYKKGNFTCIRSPHPQEPERHKF